MKYLKRLFTRIKWFFAFKNSKVILLCINIIKKNKTSEQLSNVKLIEWKYHFTLKNITF